MTLEEKIKKLVAKKAVNKLSKLRYIAHECGMGNIAWFIKYLEDAEYMKADSRHSEEKVNNMLKHAENHKQKAIQG